MASNEGELCGFVFCSSSEMMLFIVRCGVFISIIIEFVSRVRLLGESGLGKQFEMKNCYVWYILLCPSQRTSKLYKKLLREHLAHQNMAIFPSIVVGQLDFLDPDPHS
jgi:hypothetical protein